MLRNASLTLDEKAKLGGETLAALDPLPDGRLRNAAQACHRGLGPSASDCGLESFEGGCLRLHTTSYNHR